jgi:hypothetical protein
VEMVLRELGCASFKPLRMKNPDTEHLPMKLDPDKFARKWLRKVRQQVPKDAQCTILCENSSDYMRRLTDRNRSRLVEFECKLGSRLRASSGGPTLTIVCTYDWSDIESMITAHRSRALRKIEAIMAAHEEVIVITRSNRCLIGDAAQRLVMSRIARHVKRLI